MTGPQGSAVSDADGGFSPGLGVSWVSPGDGSQLRRGLCCGAVAIEEI